MPGGGRHAHAGAGCRIPRRAAPPIHRPSPARTRAVPFVRRGRPGRAVGEAGPRHAAIRPHPVPVLIGAAVPPAPGPSPPYAVSLAPIPPRQSRVSAALRAGGASLPPPRGASARLIFRMRALSFRARRALIFRARRALILRARRALILRARRALIFRARRALIFRARRAPA